MLKKLLAFSNRIDALVSNVGRISAWLVILMIVVSIADVITRRFLVYGSAAIQETVWHLHALLWASCLAWGYIEHAHVRIELLERFISYRLKHVIELIGCLVFLLPYCAILTYYGMEYVSRAFEAGEVSASPGGLPYRWISKLIIPYCMTLLGLVAISGAMRSLVFIISPAQSQSHADNNN
ncbi:TRAP transporter small permease subunit [Vibrio sp. S9_S30]|uniref:TRAP transporter small permease subunit n=1 Tax=Vibrio sp. S9_S30 TaxID=2720226 RepID=UPI001680C405|nr:TRAP transporter small permease subunit [Vibrio sp. S9_S30]MBD1557807.1 TRAP transporter small permease subunit [Vibrio sp. S9_S30]